MQILPLFLGSCPWSVIIAVLWFGHCTLCFHLLAQWFQEREAFSSHWVHPVQGKPLQVCRALLPWVLLEETVPPHWRWEVPWCLPSSCPCAQSVQIPSDLQTEGRARQWLLYFLPVLAWFCSQQVEEEQFPRRQLQTPPCTGTGTSDEYACSALGNGNITMHKPSGRKQGRFRFSSSVKCKFNSQLWIHAQFIRVAVRTERDDEIELSTTIFSCAF